MVFPSSYRWAGILVYSFQGGKEPFFLFSLAFKSTAVLSVFNLLRMFLGLSGTPKANSGRKISFVPLPFCGSLSR
jgi:hypothetical protein